MHYSLWVRPRLSLHWSSPEATCTLSWLYRHSIFICDNDRGAAGIWPQVSTQDPKIVHCRSGGELKKTERKMRKEVKVANRCTHIKLLPQQSGKQPSSKWALEHTTCLLCASYIPHYTLNNSCYWECYLQATNTCKQDHHSLRHM